MNGDACPTSSGCRLYESFVNIIIIVGYNYKGSIRML